MPHKHTWRVIFRNDRMGFQKAVDVEAVGYSQAVTFAGDKLEQRGYSRYDFAVIALERRSRSADGSTLTYEGGAS